MDEIDWTVGWVKLTLCQRLRLWWARYMANEIVVYTTDGAPVWVCADFAEVNWKAPGLYQDLIDEQAAVEAKYGLR